jgi:hypothetical protein
VNTDPVEALISEALFSVVDTPGLAARRLQQTRLRQHRDDPVALEGELAELAGMRGRGELTVVEWRAARVPPLTRIEAARTARLGAEYAEVISLYQDRTGGLRAAWGALTVYQRQAVANAVIEKIVVKRAVRRGPIFDPDRLDISWRV